MQLTIEQSDLRTIISEITREVVEQVASANPFGSRVAFSEEETAQMLGLEKHVLRDERLRGRISASKIVGARIRYTRDDIVRYLSASRFEPKPKRASA